MNIGKCTRERLACRAFQSFLASDVGGRWRELPRRDPTRAMYDEAHREKPERYGRRENENTRRALAFALSALTPLVEAGRTFPSAKEIGIAVGRSPERVRDWLKYYPEAAALIQKLLAPSE